LPPVAGTGRTATRNEPMKLEVPPETPHDSALGQDTGGSIALQSERAEDNHFVRVTLRLVPGILLLVTILAVFVPLEPAMPVSGLDMSWMIGLNQAVAQHLVFGRDIVLTFGPYASIYTELYHPATDRLMICGSLFLGLAYFLLLLLLGKGQKPFWVLIYGIVIAGLVTSRDALLFSYPLIVGLVTYRLALPDEQGMKLALSESTELIFAFLFAPLGLLPLIKVSLLPLCGVTAAICAVLLWLGGKKTLAFLATATMAISCLLLWAVAAQPILALPRFIIGTEQMISGYTEAMAFPGDPWECILYIVAAALILLYVIRKAPGALSSRLFLAALYAFFLATAFKGGFVRHDSWHNITAASSILIAAFLLIFILGGRRSLLAVAAAVIVWAYIAQGANQTVTGQISSNLLGTFERAFHGARIRWVDGELQKEYDQHMAAIRGQFPIESMPGTTDIYSFNQSWLLASANEWAPRPDFQSYESYTPGLARLNLSHLESARAPDNIVFRVEPIDGRLPSLEDGLSWPALINGYTLEKLGTLALYLRKRAPENSDPPAVSDLLSANHKFGEEVSIPEAEEPLFAAMEISQTLLGRILAAVYKPPQLYISVRLRDGRMTKYRAISNMMRTDFLLTPLVKNTEDFALLAAGGNRYLAGNQVKSIAISSDDRRGWFWNPAYSITLRALKLTKNSETENSLLFDKISNAPPASLLPPETLKCEGSLESVNARPPSPAMATIEGSLSLSGWMGIDAKDGIIPDSVFVVLTGETGKTLYIKARSTPRDDVKGHFHQTGMPDPGYAALIDVSNLKGIYHLDLARSYKGSLASCQQFRRPLRFNP
jgi:hypothetical protein